MIRNGLRVRAKETLGKLAETDQAPSTIDTDLVRELAQLVSESDLAEIEIEKGDLRIRLTRHHRMKAGSAVVPPPPLPAVVAPEASVGSPVGTASPAIEADHPGLIKSPMVGTVYRRANPESKAFVEIGATVKAGDRILLIEAMKTFNDIVAPKGGVVSAILVEDGQPVEFGEPLIVIG